MCVFNLSFCFSLLHYLYFPRAINFIVIFTRGGTLHWVIAVVIERVTILIGCRIFVYCLHIFVTVCDKDGHQTLWLNIALVYV